MEAKRFFGGSGQADATKGHLNVLPIVTMSDNAKTKTYHAQIENIAVEFVKRGGTVVFPMLQGDKVNIGTGIARKGDDAQMPNVGQNFAISLRNKLRNEKRNEYANPEAAIMIK